MPARRSRKPATRRRRSRQGVNLLDAAQSLVIANATTQALFGTTLVNFATQGWLTQKTPGNVGGAGNSWTLSASEIFGGLTGGGFGQSGQGGYTNDMAGLKKAIMRNLELNGGKSLATIVFAPVAFKVAKDLTKKPRSDANKLLKMTGLNTVVKV